MENHQIDVEKTISNILTKVNSSVGLAISEAKLRAKAKTEPEFLLEAAKFVRAEVVYQ